MESAAEMGAAPRDLLTVEQFAERFPAWTQASLRHLILNASERVNSRGERVSGNGLSPALIRDRRRVLISEGGFFAWLADQQRRRSAGERTQPRATAEGPRARRRRGSRQ